MQRDAELSPAGSYHVVPSQFSMSSSSPLALSGYEPVALSNSAGTAEWQVVSFARSLAHRLRDGMPSTEAWLGAGGRGEPDPGGAAEARAGTCALLFPPRAHLRADVHMQYRRTPGWQEGFSCPACAVAVDHDGAGRDALDIQCH